jgi:hypothetical protein
VNAERRQTRLALIVFVLGLFASLATSAHAAKRPKVVVTLVIDQLAGWIAAERVPLLPKTGGFARLRREGTWVRSLVFPHAVSDTAPGHAALYTGQPARESGIFANEIVDPDTRERVSVLRDAETRIVASDGPRDLPGSSLARLRLPTLADQLRANVPDAAIVTMSLKERAALFGGGRKPTAAIWFDVSVGRFVTSTAFARTFPTWALPVVGPDLLRQEHTRTWELSDAAFVKAHARTVDAQAGEGELPGWGIVFPHRMGEAHDPARAFRASPFADEALLDLALRAVDEVPHDGAPLLLAVSLSSNDYIGHLYGPDSWEAWDEIYRLDARLGAFFAALDAKVGPDGWAILLSADHGTITLPEAASPATQPWCEMARREAQPDRWHRACGKGHRVLPDELAERLRAVATQAIGEGDWVLGVADPYVYLTAKAHALPPAAKDKLDRALRAALAAEPGVVRVVPAHEVPARCATDDSVDALVCRALPGGVPGDYYVALAPGSFFDPDYVPGYGVSHGSPYYYDRAVPLFVRAPGRVPAGRVIDGDEPVGSFARTAADLLGVPPPPGVHDGRDLAAPR